MNTITATTLRDMLKAEFEKHETFYINCLLEEAQAAIFEGTASIDVRITDTKLMKWWDLREDFVKAYLTNLGFEVKVFTKMNPPVDCLALYTIRINWDLIEAAQSLD